MILGLHTALGVSDMDRSIRFYRDLLGMDVLRLIEISDDRLARLIGAPEAKCKIAHLTAGESVLELFQYETPSGENFARKINQYDKGLIHVGIEIDNFDETVARLREHGVEFLGELVEFRPNVWVAYFRGPDGEVCEIRQQP